MYHNNRRDVLEASDITAVHALKVERRANGKRYATLLVEIADHKELNEDTEDAVKLHVTDGVSHMVHAVTPLPEDATPLASAEEEAATLAEEDAASTEEEAPAEEVKPAARPARKR